jgi:hypothetical protein
MKKITIDNVIMAVGSSLIIGLTIFALVVNK